MTIFTELTEQEFDTFCKQSTKSAFVQSVAMKHIQEEQNKKVKLYGLKKDNEIVGAGLFVIRNVISKYTIAHCNQGPILDYHKQEDVNTFFTGLKSALKKEHCLHCIITPNFEVVSRDINGQQTDEIDNHVLLDNLKKAGLKHQGFTNEMIHGIGRWLFLKDLSTLENSDQLMASFDHPTAKAVRKTQKDQVEVVDLSLEEVGIFKELMEKTSSRRDFEDRGIEFYQYLKKHFGKDCHIKIAKINVQKLKDSLNEQKQMLQNECDELQKQIDTKMASKKIVNKQKVAYQDIEVLDKRLNEINQYDQSELILGGVLYLVYGNELTALFAGNDERYFGYNGTHAIHFDEMSQAIQQKIGRFNFYGTTGKFSGDENEGVYKFKKGFGGVLYEQPGDFHLEVSPIMNKLYHLVHKIKG